jgi:hypothetical protein
VITPNVLNSGRDSLELLQTALSAGNTGSASQRG